MPANDLPWRKWIPWFVVIFCVLLFIGLLLPAVEQAREAARRSASKNNLKQLGLAFLSYHNSHRVLPPGGVISAAGEPLRGWPILTIPYLEQSPLFAYCDMDYPWDDPVNLHLFRHGSQVFLNPQIVTQRTIESLGLMHYPTNSHLMNRNSSVSLDELTAGTTHVWMAVESFENWRPWGSPFNWQELQWPPPIADNEAGWVDGGAQLLMADSSVVYCSPDTDREVIETYRKNSPEVTPVQIARPATHWNYARTGQIPQADQVNILPTLFLHDQAKTGENPVTLARLKAAVQDSSNTLVLLIGDPYGHGVLKFDDEALAVVTQLSQLQVLRVGKIELSEDGLQQFANLKSLKILAGVATQEMATQLKEALPDCELRLRIEEEAGSQEK